MIRYFLGFLVTIGLIILLIVLIFSGGGKPKVPTTSKTLDSYASTDAQAILTIDGAINANQDHQAVRITVDRNDVTYQQISGYEGSVVSQQTFDNNQSAYSNFLYALEHANFTRGNTDKSLANERGICPAGRRYVFELRQGGSDIERFWATSCGGLKSYQGNLSLTINLFQKQVSGYDSLVGRLQNL